MALLLSRTLPVWAQELVYLAGLSELIEQCRGHGTFRQASAATVPM